MNVAEYLNETGLSIHQLALKAGISYPVLHGHVAKKKPIGLTVAKRLEAFDDRMNAAEILGLAPAPTPKRRSA